MKTSKKLFMSITISILVIASFFAGSYIKEQEYSNSRIQRCSTLVSFAIDKAENGTLSDQSTMRALISNIYAAHQFCDNPGLAAQLHDLWNYLIFESDSYVDAEDIVLHELRDILQSIKAGD